jgi:hypothetical protein
MLNVLPTEVASCTLSRINKPAIPKVHRDVQAIFKHRSFNTVYESTYTIIYVCMHIYLNMQG